MQISSSANKATMVWSLWQRILLCSMKSMNHLFSTKNAPQSPFQIQNQLDKCTEICVDAGARDISCSVYTIPYGTKTWDLTCRARESLDSRLYRSHSKYTFNRQQNGCVHSGSVPHSMAAAAEGGAASEAEYSTVIWMVQKCWWAGAGSEVDCVHDYIVILVTKNSAGRGGASQLIQVITPTPTQCLPNWQRQ